MTKKRIKRRGATGTERLDMVVTINGHEMRGFAATAQQTVECNAVATTHTIRGKFCPRPQTKGKRLDQLTEVALGDWPTPKKMPKGMAFRPGQIDRWHEAGYDVHVFETCSVLTVPYIVGKERKEGRNA